MIELLMVDDQVLFVESLKMVIENDNDDIIVAGVAHDGLEAIESVRAKQPDVILMDVRMPNLDGVEATRQIKEEFPHVKIIVLTTFDDDLYVHKALEYGAEGYLLKNIPPQELAASIHAVNSGAVMISPQIAAKLVRKAYSDIERESTPTTGDRHPLILDTLSNREMEILQMMAQGLGNKQITERLFISDQTVRNHVSVIYSKLDVHSRYDAVQKAIKAGLL